VGLDMYAFTTTKTPETAVDFTAEAAQEIAYWRKHPDLHGWMEQLYRAKGGSEADFNCVNLALDAADLDRLERDLRNRALPHTEGFFFGTTRPEEIARDFAFIDRARAALRAGETVFYTSWW
jgi:hypothetical protein